MSKQAEMPLDAAQTETPRPAADATPIPKAEAKAEPTKAPDPEDVKRALAAIPQPIDEGDSPQRALSAFGSEAGYKVAYRMACAIASSSLVPAAYQGQANAPNVMIAMELANRIGASIMMVMQSLDIIHGRPSWRAQFLIATVNSSRKFTPIRFRFVGAEGSDGWGCRAWAKDRETGEECIGALITIGLSKAEGWYTKNGSKWKTMPEQMLMYRAAAFWTRIYAPELSLGMQTTEEVIDTQGYEVRETPEALRAGSAADLERSLRNGATA